MHKAATQSTQVTSLESIRTIGESIGISNISEEACREITTDLTFTIKSIINDAQKFVRNSKRKRLIVSDVDNSLKFRMIEPVYGFNTAEYLPFKSATTGGRVVYYTEDKIVNLDDVISNNNQNVRIPNDITIKAHWLAIEGVQPSIPENPETISRDVQKKEAIEGTTKTKEKQRKLDNVKIKQTMSHDLSLEHQLYFKEITETCVGCDEAKRNEALNSLSNDPGLHQLLPRLVLFIAEGVKLNIGQNNMALLIYIMRMTRSLIDNKHLYLEKYYTLLGFHILVIEVLRLKITHQLTNKSDVDIGEIVLRLHELLPSILSCVLSKQLCSRPETDNHWALREFAARLVGQIVKHYSSTITILQAKIIKVYIRSIQSERTTFPTVYGALVGLAELGNDVCESFVFALVKMLGERIIQILDSPLTQVEKTPAEKLKQQITKIVCNVLKLKPPVADELDYLSTEFGAYFGPFIHASLMKLRNVAAANVAATGSHHKTTLIHPQTSRSQPQSTTPRTTPTATNTTSIVAPQVSQSSSSSSTPTSTMASPKVYKVLQTNFPFKSNKVQVVNASPNATNVTSQLAPNTLSTPPTPPSGKQFPSNEFS